MELLTSEPMSGLQRGEARINSANDGTGGVGKVTKAKNY
jgi:hypothetical protein